MPSACRLRPDRLSRSFAVVLLTMACTVVGAPANENSKSIGVKKVARPTTKGGSSFPNVEIHRPTLPKAIAGSGLFNPIDLLLQAHFKSVGVDIGHTVPETVFARRVYLDLIGLLPSPSELDQFAGDSRSDKRTQLVRRLLDQRADYAVHWLAFWNDLLRNEYRGTGFIDDGRRQITGWLFRSLYDNRALRPLRARAGQPGEGLPKDS